MAAVRVILALFAAGLVAACGDSPSAPTYTVGGTVVGLSGAGLVLQNNGGDNRTVAASGSFTFSAAIASGGAYSVTVLTQPTNQNCVVSNGSGTVGSGNITNVTVSCTTPTFTIGGFVSGLSGTGLVLQNNGGNNRAITTIGEFTFSAAVASGTAYNVTVLTQPTNQLCAVSNGSGTAIANVTNVTVDCTSPFAGYEAVQTFVTTGAVGTVGTVSAICPGIKRVLSGGWTSDSGIEVWRVWRSRAVGADGAQNGDRGWALDFTSVVAGQSVSVRALCATPAPTVGYEAVTAAVATGAVGTLAAVPVICPGTKRAMGGGYSSASGLEVWRVFRNRSVDAGGVQTGDRGWAVAFISVVAGQSVTAHAVCAAAPAELGYELVSVNTTTGAAGTLGSVSVNCPGIKRVLGGGYVSSSFNDVWRVWRSRAVDAGGLQSGDRGWGVNYTSVLAFEAVTLTVVCGVVPN